MPDLRERLLAGESIAGVFEPVGDPGDGTAGMLSWSQERGAELELIGEVKGWPMDFGDRYDVHGIAHSGGELSLLNARTRRTSLGDIVVGVAATTVAVGALTTSDQTWDRSHYRPGALHEWIRDTGFEWERPEEKFGVRFSYTEPPKIQVPLPSSQLTLWWRASSRVEFGPSWSISTSVWVGARPEEPLTIDAHRRRFRDPLLAFSTFVSDTADHILAEEHVDSGRRERVSVLEWGSRGDCRKWDPRDGRFLFASEVLDLPPLLQAWFSAWGASVPALGLLQQVISDDTYSAPRFLTLYTAAEQYWKSTKSAKEGPWRVGRLAERAGLDMNSLGLNQEKLSLIGATRNYHAHLSSTDKFGAEFIEDQTFESTRRLHVLLQACVLHDLGLSHEDIQEAIASHYRSWPIP